jgi:hypothetical protein
MSRGTPTRGILQATSGESRDLAPRGSDVIVMQEIVHIPRGVLAQEGVRLRRHMFHAHRLKGLSQLSASPSPSTTSLPRTAPHAHLENEDMLRGDRLPKATSLEERVVMHAAIEDKQDAPCV